jgi:hypothetical protein
MTDLSLNPIGKPCLGRSKPWDWRGRSEGDDSGGPSRLPGFGVPRLSGAPARERAHPSTSHVGWGRPKSSSGAKREGGAEGFRAGDDDDKH